MQSTISDALADIRLAWPVRYDEAEAAEFLGVSADTLRNWRAQKRGPKWIKYIGRVYYAKEALLQWRAANEITNG